MARPPRKRTTVAPSVHWSADPSRATRLLDWLDVHPVERNVLFCAENRGGHKPAGTLLKKTCAARAALAVFAQDQDAALRRLAVDDPDYLGHAITDYVRKKWRSKYQRMNQLLGVAATNLSCEEMSEELLGTVEKVTEKFPEWERLHRHWRTNAYYNPYYHNILDTAEVNTVRVDTAHQMECDPPVETRAQRHHVHQEVIIIDDTPSPVFQEDIAELKMRTFAEEDLAIAVGRLSTSTTLSQTHELALAELAFKRRKLELEYQGRRFAAEIIKEEFKEGTRCKKDIMAHLAAFVSGGSLPALGPVKPIV